MAAELIETGIKYEKRVNGTRNSVRKVPTVKTGLYLFPLFPGIFQWDEPTKRFPLGGVLGISSAGDDRMEPKVNTQKDP